MSFSTGGGARTPQINVTPLIDVLLTLIIVFMIVVAMDPEYVERVQIPQPDQKSAPQPPQPRTILIEVIQTDKDHAPSVKINHEDVLWQDLETRVAGIYLKRVEKVAFVRADDDVDFQYVADVIDVVRHAGVIRVGLLTQGRDLAGE